MDGRNAKKKTNIKLTLITLTVLVAITVVLLFIFVGSKKKAVKISDYVICTYTGVDGGGILNCALDTQALYEDIAGSEKNAVLLKNIATLVEGIEINADKTSRLYNGEEVLIRAEYDSELADKLGCRFTGTEYTVTVSGLGEGTAIDIFENIDVVVAGISPAAYANVVNKWQEDYLKNITFSLDKSVDIALGDVLTVTCEADDAKLSQMGISVLEKQKQYKVDKIDSYIRTVDELDMNQLMQIKNECMSTIKTETEDLTFRMLYKASKDSAYLFQYNNEWVNAISFEGAEFLYRLDNHDVKQMNYIEMIFKADISNGTSDMEVWFIFEFADSIITSDGAVEITKSDMKSRYVCGTDYNELYGRVVLSKENSYDISQIEGLN